MNSPNFTTKLPPTLSTMHFFNMTTKLNVFILFFVTIFGILGNFVTILLLTVKINNKKKLCTNCKFMIFNLFHFKNSFTSFQTYMLALATSDIIFLFAHLFEDILPNLATLFTDFKFLQIVNSNSTICKLVLYLRNATRINSSYLIVLFALERYVITNSPLKRFFFKRKTRHLITCVFCFSIVITSYTIPISGLRRLEDHEENNFIMHECDVLNEYKLAYKYIVICYIAVCMLLPILLIIFFNALIIGLLCTRKKALFKMSFPIITYKGKKSSNNSWDDLGINSVATPSTKTSVFNDEEIIRLKQYDSELINWMERVNTIPETKACDSRIQATLGFDRNLIVISAFYVFLNAPYIISWFIFFVPMAQEKLSYEQIHFRYAFVQIFEVFHMLNFSINFLFYYFAVKYCKLSRRNMKNLK